MIHPDIVLPEGWFGRLDAAVEKVAALDRHWGLAGVMGVARHPETHDKRLCFGHLLDRNYEAGVALTEPAPVEALDECCVILRGGRDWVLDEGLGTYHLWASELAMREASYGRNTYVLPGLYLEHHSTAPHTMPADAYFFFGLGVLSERYRHKGGKNGAGATPLVTPSGSVHDYGDHRGVQIL